MIAIAYVPEIIFVIDIILYVVYSKRLKMRMEFNSTLMILCSAFIAIYSMNITYKLAIIQILITLAIGSEIRETYIRLR